MDIRFETNMYYAFGAYIRGLVKMDELYRGIRITPELVQRYKPRQSFKEAMELRHRPYVYGTYRSAG